MREQERDIVSLEEKRGGGGMNFFCNEDSLG